MITSNNFQKGDGYLQAEFSTKQAGIELPATPFSLPVSSSVEELSVLVNQLMSEQHPERVRLNFDFLINGILLRLTLNEFLEQHNISTEKVLEIECIVREPPPSPESELTHEDWVSAVRTTRHCLISGCYDNSVNIWSREALTVLQRSKSHAGPVKCLTLVGDTSESDDCIQFASGSQDQILLLWEYSTSENRLSSRQVYKGHERSVECVCSNKDGTRLASGGFDGFLKIWNTERDEHSQHDEKAAGDMDSKKRKLNGNSLCPTKTPMVTLHGHREVVTAVGWSANVAEVFTASWDHSIILWDLELAGQKSCWNGNKAFTSLSYSPLNGLLITGSVDKNVRLWDPRSKEGSMVKKIFTSHNGWISGVVWSRTKEHLFASVSYDNSMKLWDTRSPKAPLYDLKGHKDRLLCCDWSEPDLLVSGGVDCTVKMFKNA